MPTTTALRCVCPTYDDGSTYTGTCPIHAAVDPCLTMAQVTGRRRVGTIRRGTCTSCGWTTPPPPDPRLAVAAAYVTARFYPPLPGEYAALAVEAVDACEEGDLDRVITLPEYLNPKPRAAYVGDDIEGRETWYVTARDLANVLRLDRLVDEWLD